MAEIWTPLSSCFCPAPVAVAPAAAVGTTAAGAAAAESASRTVFVVAKSEKRCAAFLTPMPRNTATVSSPVMAVRRASRRRLLRVRLLSALPRGSVHLA